MQDSDNWGVRKSPHTEQQFILYYQVVFSDVKVSSLTKGLLKLNGLRITYYSYYNRLKSYLKVEYLPLCY